MKTLFATAERASDKELLEAVKLTSHNPVIDGLMKSISGLVAVLNGARQILSVNDAALSELGIKDLDSVLGLRPGELIHCIHADGEPNGCGTTAWCASCGAAIAIVSSIEHDQPEERICAAAIDVSGKREDRCFRVQAIPIHFEAERYILLFMQDITHRQKREELDAAFYHDLNSTLTGLMGVSDLLADEHGEIEDARCIRELVRQLSRDVELHRVLYAAEEAQIQPVYEQVRLIHLLEELQFNLSNAAVAEGKRLDIRGLDRNLAVSADRSLLRRILMNMLTNAFEATAPGDVVRFWMEMEADCSVCCVWNRAVIPEKVRLRIFQRHFSTKQGVGRGLGTYSMKLFAENVMGGKISFTSSAEDGTVFRLALPLRRQPDQFL